MEHSRWNFSRSEPGFWHIHERGLRGLSVTNSRYYKTSSFFIIVHRPDSGNKAPSLSVERVPTSRTIRILVVVFVLEV